MEDWLLLGSLIIFLLAHLQVTKKQHGAALSAEALKSEIRSARCNHELFSKQLREARIQMLKTVSSVMIHFAFLFLLIMIWKFVKEPGIGSLGHVLAGMITYVLYVVSSQVRTDDQFGKFKALVLLTHLTFSLATACETDLVMFDMAEKIATIGTVLSSILLIDTSMTLPMYACQTALLTYCRWNLIGFTNVTSFIAFASLATNVIAGGLIALCVLHIRSNIAAKLDSGEASSLMLGFRQMLRGVCDGDFVLDRRTMTIVDDGGLQRVLKSSRNFKNTNFLDLFLDTESREQISKFLAAQDPTESGIPRGLRVTLQDSCASDPRAVSMDLFHTTLPAVSAYGASDYCLLAMKEDPEQFVADAPPDSAPSLGKGQVSASSGRSRSSVSELLEANDDLQELALLVSDATGFLDLEEVHLSFQRQSPVSNIESGMPTLRRFIRPCDWDRIEKMFEIVSNLPEPQQRQRCYFRRPTFFRVPGASRSYLCARSTSLRLADPSVVAGMPSRFWMHLTQFDSQIQGRPWEQALEDIEEE